MTYDNFYEIFIKLKDGQCINQYLQQDFLDIKDIKEQIKNENKIICFGTIGVDINNIDYYTINPKTIIL